MIYKEMLVSEKKKKKTFLGAFKITSWCQAEKRSFFDTMLFIFIDLYFDHKK